MFSVLYQSFWNFESFKNKTWGELYVCLYLHYIWMRKRETCRFTVERRGQTRPGGRSTLSDTCWLCRARSVTAAGVPSGSLGRRLQKDLRNELYYGSSWLWLEQMHNRVLSDTPSLRWPLWQHKTRFIREHLWYQRQQVGRKTRDGPREKLCCEADATGSQLKPPFESVPSGGRGPSVVPSFPQGLSVDCPGEGAEP